MLPRCEALLLIQLLLRIFINSK